MHIDLEPQQVALRLAGLGVAVDPLGHEVVAEDAGQLDVAEAHAAFMVPSELDEAGRPQQLRQPARGRCLTDAGWPQE